MRIPLDYYRMLGIGVQASTAQVDQAYQERLSILPRREYSDFATVARKHLLDRAYGVLGDHPQRVAYTQEFQQMLQESETGEGLGKPWVEVEKRDLVGALILMLELGEYEATLKIAAPFLDTKQNLALTQGQLGEPQIVRADLILSMALACLHLAREQWQLGHYEAAATVGDRGLHLLAQEGIFLGLRGELQGDLFKLRPYRILELVAQGDQAPLARERGIQLLRNILEERGGIEGAGEDHSGLNTDDFLRFVQQVRSYLTIKEQQNLFLQEAQRPSPVAAYLASYALIAGGFCGRQPEQILQAQIFLKRLAKRQDVGLERAICALMLGQTDEALTFLSQSRDQQVVQLIQQASGEAEDALPGLCFYTERWLSKEVFPYFRDLSRHSSSLQAYFADERVQTVLEDLPEPPPERESPPPPQEKGEKGGKLEKTAPIAADKPSPPAGTGHRTPRRGRSGSGLVPWGAMALVLLLGGAMVALVQVVERVLTPPVSLPSPGVALPLNQPPVAIPPRDTPPANGKPPSTEGELTQEQAKQVVITWLNKKALAFGPDHQVDALKEILTGKALQTWSANARNLSGSNTYRMYEHQVQVLEIQGDPAQSQGSVLAQVQEKSDFYIGRTRNPRESYNASIKVRYGLVKGDRGWLIDSINVAK